MNYRKLIVENGLRMIRSGLTVETWGNISCRDKETGLVYMTPSAMDYNTITEEDIVVCSLDGTIVESIRKPTIEKDLHLSIYRARNEVNAVVHTHPVYSMIYACQGKVIPLIIDEAAQALGDVCKSTNYELPGSLELAQECVLALGKEANSCLLHSHGAVCIGADMDAAFKVATVLEATAQINYMIEATGCKATIISEENVMAMKDFVKNHYGQDK
ncbi:L-fuculose-phosphate aldolase [Lachnotalea glycerini]|jgi:L-fuculose-phosphate aldolase|uniref:Class II aldolase/adducin family protein n=1 Tax=Lachnotalea glycerini TaxID=1763509 RepID=A0A318ER84_9FIRM|nr:class II aldolase/adducin family protein [Lachnotalea glycerini]PXV95495.1 L-fuculose-phosphate aldolase [Lachnotalea glycerini]RDY32815.1 class II aldolase/adducin family protein [Lachnotalea glycerini]